MSASNRPLSVQDTRGVAIDTLRGLTIFVMVFVNDVVGVKGLPWWTRHIPAGRNGIIYVDVVSPASLRCG